MAKILLTLPLPEPAPRMLQAGGEVVVLGGVPSAPELTHALRDADVACLQLRDKIDERSLSGADRLKAICVYAVGYDNVDVDAATRRGIYVTNTPDVLTAATADCAVGLMLAAARRLREGDAVMRAGEFPGWGPEFMLGLDLSGATLSLVGFGRIAQAVARRAKAFGMRILYVSRGEREVPPELGDASRVTLDRALAEADVISLHVPLTPETHHMIDEHALRAMKPTSILVNTARGPVVDEAALVRALSEGWIGGAGLDVYEREPEMAPGLAACQNAVLSPHLGSATTATRAAMAQRCAANALAALAGEIPPDALDRSAGQVRQRRETLRE